MIQSSRLDCQVGSGETRSQREPRGSVKTGELGYFPSAPIYPPLTNNFGSADTCRATPPSRRWWVSRYRLIARVSPPAFIRWSGAVSDMFAGLAQVKRHRFIEETRKAGNCLSSGPFITLWRGVQRKPRRNEASVSFLPTFFVSFLHLGQRWRR